MMGFFRKRVAIVTLPLGHNYGGILQNYALQMVLRNLGYLPDNILNKAEWQCVPHLTRCVKLNTMISGAFRKYILRDKTAWVRPWIGDKDSELFYQRLEDNKFAAIRKAQEISEAQTRLFVQKRIRQYNGKNWKRYNAYIVGSDQVWRQSYASHMGKYFLDFLPSDLSVKRIVYAASFGLDYAEFSVQEVPTLARELAKFDSVSVREASGVKICGEILHRTDAVVMPDPTFLLDAADYKKLIHKNKINGKQKLFCYILDDTLEKERIRREIADELNLEIHLNCLPAWDEAKETDSVEDWLGGIANASFVLADSFHGIVFALLFNKPFLAIGNRERGLARFQTLLKHFHLEHRLILSESDATEELIHETISFESVNHTLEDLRAQGIRFLKKNLRKG